MEWWDKYGGAVMAAVIVFGLTALLWSARDNDEETVHRVATMPQMDNFSEVATGTYGSISLREFDYKNKRCLWASFGRQAGLTCWNKE